MTCGRETSEAQPVIAANDGSMQRQDHLYPIELIGITNQIYAVRHARFVARLISFNRGGCFLTPAPL
jgi:hypothetical protein